MRCVHCLCGGRNQDSRFKTLSGDLTINWHSEIVTSSSVSSVVSRNRIGAEKRVLYEQDHSATVKVTDTGPWHVLTRDLADLSPLLHHKGRGNRPRTLVGSPNRRRTQRLDQRNQRTQQRQCLRSPTPVHSDRRTRPGRLVRVYPAPTALQPPDPPHNLPVASNTTCKVFGGNAG
jgi:hypothetical protein